MVCEEAFAGLAEKWNLSTLILVGRGDIANRQMRLPSIMADVVEAICAAIYLDGGLEELKQRILPWLEELDAEVHETVIDYKTILQEKIQPLGLGAPVYHTIKQEGPAHCPVFTVEVTAASWHAVGTGSSLKAAGRAAAKKILEQLALEPGDSIPATGKK